jgi:hypothetical protein
MSGKSIAIFLVLIVFIGACQSFGHQGRKYPSIAGTFNVTGEFIINPATILDELDRGERNVFQPMLATPSDDTILPSGSIQWTQSDYLQVANALSQLVWNETLDGWLIFFLAFQNTCQDNLSGFDGFEAIYYKTITGGFGKVYTARHIEIYPLASIVYWAGDTDFPISSGWAAINLRKFKITADDALRIAEENGGAETRARAHNDCRIGIYLPAHTSDNRWDVAYYYSPRFEIYVDPYSGKYEVPTPVPTPSP